jgi:DegV family protein with EDD domain
MIAKEEYEREHPERHVFVLNSLSTGPEMALIIDRFRSEIESGADFDDACNKTVEYSNKTGLFFVLESLKNLANNGRVSPIVAKMAGLLGIRLVGRASDKGDLEPIGKCRGEAKAIDCVVENLEKYGFSGGKIKIAHCFNEEAAEKLKSAISKRFASSEIEVYNCRGLVGFYAELGGLLIGFEHA